MIFEVKGDLNLLFSQVDSHPERNEQVVLVLDPSTGTQVLTREEACSLLPSPCEPFGCIEDFVVEGLALYYRPDQVVRLKGRLYLVGQAAVCREDEDGNRWSLTGRDICRVMGYTREHSTLLCVDGQKIPVLPLE